MLAGCGTVTAAPEVDPVPTPSTAPEHALPDGVSLSVYQTRIDVGMRRLEVSIDNRTGGSLTITRLELRSEQFVAPAIWEKAPSTLRSGVTVDLPLFLPDADCAAVDPVPVVEFDYVRESGDSGTAVAIAEDRYTRMPALLVEDCVAQSVAEVVRLSTSMPRPITIDGMNAVELDLVSQPTGAPGSVVIESLGATTLFTPADPHSGRPVGQAQLGWDIRGTDASSTVTLTLVPARCDAHAIAEDKRGTIMPLAVTVGGVEGRVFISADDEVRGALYDFITATCAG